MLYLITFILAFCSIVYELLLGQILSAFLGNTVLRYSVTIGLYMFSMGIGATLVRGRFKKLPVVRLQLIEILLAVFGGFSLSFLFFLESLGTPVWLFSIIAHSLIILIGILTGIEIPLLIEIRNLSEPDSHGSVLGVDYLGAFAGTLVFAFFCYPRAGLVATGFIIAALNAAAGLLLFTQNKSVESEVRKLFKRLTLYHAAIFILLIFCLVYESSISEFLIQLYLGERG